MRPTLGRRQRRRQWQRQQRRISTDDGAFRSQRQFALIASCCNVGLQAEGLPAGPAGRNAETGAERNHRICENRAAAV